MQAGEECGFHGNPRKAELWVSVPALHCTGPRLSAALLSLSSLPHYSFLFTPPFSPLQSLPSPAPPHLPPSCERGSLTHTHTHIRSQLHIIHTRINLCCHCFIMQALSYKHNESMCSQPQPASPHLLPGPSPLIQTPPSHTPTHTHTYCTSSGLSSKANACSHCAAMCLWPCCNGEMRVNTAAFKSTEEHGSLLRHISHMKDED